MTPEHQAEAEALSRKIAAFCVNREEPNDRIAEYPCERFISEAITPLFDRIEEAEQRDKDRERYMEEMETDSVKDAVEIGNLKQRLNDVDAELSEAKELLNSVEFLTYLNCDGAGQQQND